MLAALLFAQFVLTPAVGSADHTAIASNRGVIMLVWSDDSTVRWRRFAASGEPLDGAPTVIAATGVTRASVAASGSVF